MHNSKVNLKVCGLRDNIDEVMTIKPDFIGFIFYPKSPRYVGEHFVMPSNLTAQKIGVFVNQSIDEVFEKQKAYGLDCIQLHGDESVDYCVELKSIGLKIIKVFAGNKLLNQRQLDEYAEFIDYYLFDTKLDKHGGNGVAFDWTELKKLRLKKPYILSGGIGLNNMNMLLQSDLSPFAIDVNSKFEVSPGLKDMKKLNELKTMIS